MSNVTFYFILFSVVLMCSCSHQKQYFSGELLIVDDISQTDTLVGEKIVLNGAYNGMVTLCDSLLFFYNHQMPDFQYSCFNLANGDLINNFLSKGRGTNEFINVTPIIQIYEENGDKKTLFTAINEEKAGIFNITKSIQENRTVLDTVFDLKWRDRYTKPLSRVFWYDENKIIVYRDTEKTFLKDISYSLPQYLVLNYQTNEIERTYDLYTDFVVNPDDKWFNEGAYASYGMIDPDRNKIAMCMNLLPQINILDLVTGQLKGITISKPADFECLRGSKESMKFYYHHLDVDAKYIYALYTEVSYEAIQSFVGAQIIHVFDWNGNFVRKLFLNNAISMIQIDAKNRLLYGANIHTGDIYQYKL